MSETVDLERIPEPIRDAGTPIVSDDRRLAALDAYEILDTPAETGFDDIVSLATQLCDVPVALVSLVDRDRQWFKARVGFAPCETDLDRSVCRHVLGRAEVLEIRDLALDPRTVDNPLVREQPFLRFYAGAPLNTPDGLTLGALCVIDHEPRPAGLSTAQRAGLKSLAAQVMSQLELRRAVAQRDQAMERREVDRLAALAEAARLEAMIATQQAVAAAEADLGVVFQAVTDGALRVVDAADGAVVELRNGDDLVYDTVSGTSSPHHRLRLPIAETFSGRAVLAERPMHCPDTQADPAFEHPRASELGIRSMVVVPVTRRGEPIGALKVQSARPDAFSPRDVVMVQMLAGLVAAAFGDVGEAKAERALRRAEVRYRQTFESVTEFAVVVMDREGCVTEWNVGAERIFGWSAVEIRGRSAACLFTPEDRATDRLGTEMAEALRSGRASDERWHLRKDGGRFYASGNMMPLRGDGGEHLGFIKIARDRTEQHLAAHRVQELERQLAVAQEVGGVGPFMLDLVEGRLEGPPAFSRLFGVEHGDGHWRQEEFERLVLPEDRHLMVRGDDRSGTKPFEIEYRVRRADDGEIRWLSRTARFQHDPTGRAVRFTGVVRDVTAIKEARVALVASEAKWRGLFEDLREGFLVGEVVRDGAGRIVDWRYEEVNAAWGELIGIDPAAAVGRTVREVFPSIEDEWVDDFASVVRTGEPVRFTRRVGQLDRWYEGFAQAAGGDRFSALFLEVTDRVLAEQRREALRELGDAIALADDPEAIPAAAAAIVGRALNVGRVGYGTLGGEGDGERLTTPTEWTAEGYPVLAGEYRLEDFGRYAADLRRGRTVTIPDVRLDPRTRDTADVLANVAVGSLVNYPVVERGRTVAILYVNDRSARAWTPAEVGFVADAAERIRAALQRRRAERALREGEERQRLAIEVGGIGVWELDVATREVVFDARMRAMHGVSAETLDAATTCASVHPDDRDALEDGLRRLAAGELPRLAMEYRAVGIEDGVVRTIDMAGMADRDAAGAAIRLLGAARDVTARVEAEEQRVLLNGELSHRLKNTLGVVQAIANQTFGAADRDAMASFGKRLSALASAHEVLLRQSWSAADLRQVAIGVLSTFDAGDRFELSGPDLAIGPRATLALSLLLHELATNATKYGALSVPEGRLTVEWHVVGEGPDAVVSLRWAERGGPPAAEPSRKGFGSRIIRMGLTGSGGATVRYGEEGLTLDATATMRQLQQA